LAALATEMATGTFTTVQLTAIGTNVAAAVHVTVCGAAATAVGTTIATVACGAVVVFGFWLLGKLLNSVLTETMETLDSFKDTADFFGEVVLA
jgi:hypothetical protein